MRQSSQVGSIIAYIGIALALAAILIGGVYIIRHQTAQKQPSAVEVDKQQDPVVSTNGSKERSQEQEKSESLASESAQKKEQAAEEESSNKSSVAELPQTGGSEVLYTMLTIGLLTGIGVAYMQSRRQVVAF